MKNKFIQSAFILTIGGLISKILGMLIKIVLTRVVTTEGIGLYMMILPTFNLFITLATLGLPIAIAKIISEQKKTSKKIIAPIIPLILLFNLALIIIIILISPILSNKFLQNPDTYYPLLAIGLTLPFISLSAILKGYFFGKERMFPHTLSNIIEQLVRLALTITFIKKLLIYGLPITITGVVLINILSELASIITMLLFLPSKPTFTKQDFQSNKEDLKDILNISIPATGGRLIGSLSYFLEPIILTNVLLSVGYSNDFIIKEYGIITGYVYPLVLLPSFFTGAISNALLPIISNHYAKKKYNHAQKKLLQAIAISLAIGIPVTLIFIICPEIPLKLIYNTQEGLTYIRVIAPFFLLHYIQAPLTASMQAMNKAKEAMIGTFIGTILKITTLYLTSLLSIGLWGLILSSIINIIFVTLQHAYYVITSLKKETQNTI